MISKTIVDAFKADETMSGLAGSSIYAESGAGDEVVVVKTTTTGRPVDTIAELKTSNIQVLVSGWEFEEGEAIANRAMALIEGFESTTLADGNKVKSVLVRNEPILIEWEGIKTFSLNMTVKYIQGG